jgi:membrane-associated phospholipid phosphatase
MIIPLLVTAVLSAPRNPPRPQPEPAPSVAALPSRIAHDLGRLARRGPLLSLAAGGAIAGGVHGTDVRAVHSLSSSHAIEESLDGGATAGGGVAQVGAAVAIYAIGGLAHKDGVARLGSALVEAQAVSGILTQGIKLAADRRRPDGGRYSFPSGHTSATFATADVLERTFGWKVGLPAYLGAAYVATSRVAERRHYLSDVAFGAAIGIASSRSLALRVRQHEVAARPTLGHGEIGLVISVH